MSNRLAHESSLYLKQHAENPVNWFPWGAEALAKAKAEDKPLLISIGYSSCHWCHVMAHESFENDYIAKLMDQHFVCVKVDREERPDLDQIYMQAVQMINQHGGWPLNVFCLPDGRPFFGGTYFPPEDRGQGMVPWPQLLMRVSDFYRRDREKLEENAANIVHNLAAMNQPLAAADDTVNHASLLAAGKTVSETHDDDFGGFGQAPKFPPSMTLDFLLELRRGLPQEENGALADRLDRVTGTTLSAMAHGGIFDQVAGGFARYSVDRFWLIPHFEKMLYDNGLLLDVYTKAWHRFRHPLFRQVAEETVDWAEREMRAPHGLYYSSLDADSEGEEGKFTVWNPQEVEDVLGREEGEAFCAAYNITPEGNFEHGQSNPALVVAEVEERDRLAPARQKLLEARERRIRPARDEKQLVAWNSLFIRGLAEAAFSFDRPEYFERARRAADFIWDHLRFGDNRLHAVYHEEARLNGYLDDYAFYAEALLGLAAHADFFAAGLSRTFIDRARLVTESVLTWFGDAEAPGFYFTSSDHEQLISRRKEWLDSAIPAGNSSLLHVFSRLHALTGDGKYQSEFNRLQSAYASYATRTPGGIGHALAAIAAERHGLAVLKVKDLDDWGPLADLLREEVWQRIFVLKSDGPHQPAGFQLCIGPHCLKPVTQLADLRSQMQF